MTEKEKIRAYIESQIALLDKNNIDNPVLGVSAGIVMSELKHLLSFIDNLQEEPVSNDLEETLKDYAYQVAYDLSNDWLEDNATWDDVETAVKLGAQWQKQKLIDKACEWLRQHMKTLPELSNKDLTKHTLWKRDEIIDKFRQAMEE